MNNKFIDTTRYVRSITHNLENIRYMAPEKFEDNIKKRVPYDIKCEIYR